MINLFRDTLRRLETAGWLVSTPTFILTPECSDEELGDALQGQISLCPSIQSRPVAIFDGATFDAERLIVIFGAAVESLLRQP